MVVWILFAVPLILIFGGLGLALKSPQNFILGKILFEFKEYERAVVYRFGKFHRLVEPGWRLIIPVIETFSKYDLRTEAVDIPPQAVITKDGIELLIDAILYLRVEDPVKAELEVEADYRKAVEEHVKGRLRNTIGGLDINTLYAKIEDINNQLKEEVQELVGDWGVLVIDFELQTITLPVNVVKAIEAREIAERYKEAAKEEALATEIRINAIENAAGKLSGPALNYLYLNTLKEMADGRASKIIFPLEFTKLAEGIGKGVGGMKKGDLEAIAEKYLGPAAAK